MPDTFDDPFTDLRDVPPAHGSAAEARQRGDRIRRHRATSVVTGSALAVALTVGGVAWSQASVPSTSPDPVAPSPSVTEPTPGPTSPEPDPAPSRTPDGPTLIPQPAQSVRTAIAADFPLTAGWPPPDPEMDPQHGGPSPQQPAFDAAVVCSEAVDLRPDGSVGRLGARLSGIVVGGTWTLYSTIYHVVRQGNALLLAYDGGEGGGSDAAMPLSNASRRRR